VNSGLEKLAQYFFIKKVKKILAAIARIKKSLLDNFYKRRLLK
jgi:hypothetical protein